MTVGEVDAEYQEPVHRDEGAALRKWADSNYSGGAACTMWACSHDQFLTLALPFRETRYLYEILPLVMRPVLSLYSRLLVFPCSLTETRGDRDLEAPVYALRGT